MAIDIRATVTCSLGTLISGTISDEYVQSTGLIKCKGSCELSGIYTPAVGDEVTFSYTKDGTTRKVPRKLRVLSSFADPFRRTTKVELGCKLTYLQDLQEPIDWTPFDDILNNEYTVDDAEIITIPIHASSVMDKCLTELGITASENPLTSKFSIDRFDFSPGYVQVLSDLLVSESYCGYLDRNEELVVFSLDQEGGTGPVITSNEIIDLGPIGVGQLPGEAVVVSYSTLKLKEPDAGSNINWEQEETIEILQPKVVPYGTNQSRTFTGRQVTTVQTQYDTLSLATAVSTGSWYYWQSLGQYRDVVLSRTTTVTSPSAYVEENRVVQLLNNGVAYASTDIVSSQTVETNTYNKTTGEPLRTETLRYEDRRVAYSRLGLQLVYSSSDYVNPSGLVLVGKTIVDYERSGDFTKTLTSEYVWSPERQVGSQAVAEARDVFATASEVAAYLGSIEGVLVHANTKVSTTQQGVTNYEGRPASSERTNAASASGGDPNNGWRTESTAELELALGSATAQRRIEFTLPYPPDDTFTKVGNPPSYGYLSSDAPEKASRYGRVQNMLLLGNRSGMNLQLSPEKLPTAPFDAFTLEANGLSALYRCNGTSWQMDASGILVSTDALFWGAVGGTGDWFFPTAPGITTLPTTPAVVDTAPETVLGTVATVGGNPQTTLDTAFPSAVSGDGVQDLATDEFWVYDGAEWSNVGTTPGPTTTVTSVVPVWNETVLLTGTLRVGIGVQSLPYAMELLTTVDPITVNVGLTAQRITKVEVPAAGVALEAAAPIAAISATVKPLAAAVTLEAIAPAVSISATVAVPAADMALTAETPVVVTGVSVAVPLADMSVSGQAPVSVGPPPALLEVPAADVVVAAAAPEVVTGAAIAVPAVDIAMGASEPVGAGAYDANFSSVSLLLHMDGSNNGTTFTDSSTNALTVTANGNAKTSTAQSKFGGASALFDGTGDSLTVPSNNLLTLDGNFTIEFWVYINTLKQSGLVANGASSFSGTAFVIVLDHSTHNNKIGIWNFPSLNGVLCTTPTVTTAQWYHVAFVRSGTTLTPYLDGVASTTATTSATFTTSATNLRVGRYWSGDFDGYIDDLRITKGVARYTSNFTPTTVPFPDR